MPRTKAGSVVVTRQIRSPKSVHDCRKTTGSQSPLVSDSDASDSTMVRCPGNVQKLLEFAWDYDVRKWKHCWTAGAGGETVEKPTVSAFEGT